MYNCKECGIELTALNISDYDNDYCQKCFAELIDQMPTDDECKETKDIPDWGIDLILNAKRPQLISKNEITMYAGNTSNRIIRRSRA